MENEWEGVGGKNKEGAGRGKIDRKNEGRRKRRSG